MAVIVDKAYLVDRFPEFSGVADSRIHSLNETAMIFVSEGVFGTAYKYAIALIIAHMLKMAEQSGSGPVTSEKVGDLSRSYGNLNLSNWALTGYGQEFEVLAKTKARGMGAMYVPTSS